MFAVKTSKRTAYRRRATALIQAAVFGALVGVGMMALAIDTGFMAIIRGEMQRVADSSALAGASGLLEGNAVATARANEYAGLNSVYQDAVATNEIEVTIGNWEGIDREFFPANGLEDVSPNAVRVSGARTGLPLFFAPFLGINTTGVKRDATALVGSGTCAGIWGLEGITGDGNIYTDSYDSTDGAYGPGNINPNGDICSCQNITLRGDVDIFGDAVYGDGYDLITQGNAYNIWGIVDDQPCEPFAPALPDAVANNDNATIPQTDRGRDPFQGPWNLVVTGNDNLTLNGGTYYCTSVRIDGQATLTITGPTTLFVAGTAEFTGGGVLNINQDPSDLIIYSIGPTLTLSGNAGFYGAV
ncbi:MAG: TadG family pilus assembly protein, partial [Planctomycetota bacterium]|nr:TadG family pilus assembly protein [Planctomycetota bacterium]